MQRLDWELAMGEKKTQKTRPKKGKPVEIPVPKRKDFERALKAAVGNKASNERSRG